MQNSPALRELFRDLWLVFGSILIGSSLSIIITAPPTLPLQQTILNIALATAFIIVSFVRGALILNFKRVLKSDKNKEIRSE